MRLRLNVTPPLHSPFLLMSDIMLCRLAETWTTWQRLPDRCFSTSFCSETETQTPGDDPFTWADDENAKDESEKVPPHRPTCSSNPAMATKSQHQPEILLDPSESFFLSKSQKQSSRITPLETQFCGQIAVSRSSENTEFGEAAERRKRKKNKARKNAWGIRKWILHSSKRIIG